MDLFLAAGAGLVLYQCTMNRHEKLNNPTPPQKFAAMKVQDTAYVSLGVNNLNHPEASQVNGQTKFSDGFREKYERRRRVRRHQTPDKLNAMLTKRQCRIKPQTGKFANDPLSIHQYSYPYENHVGQILTDSGVHVNAAYHAI